MKDKLIIIAAGEGNRWGNHTGTTKHLVVVDGESLLARQVRLFDWCDVTIIGSSLEYKIPGADLIIPAETGKRDVNMECVLTEKLWNKEGRTLITLGDIFFTEEAVETIRDYKKKDMMFFGREGEGVTCEYGELFCHSFYPHQHHLYKEAYETAAKMYEVGKINNCEWWEHYRILDNIDPNIHEVGEHFTEINDMTDDFDFPKDYDIWQKLYSNS